jgi:DEAD/DEAH box helicase domain-containing protein
MNKETVINILKETGFQIDYQRTEEAREATFTPYDDLYLSDRSKQLLKDRDINLWSHQHDAIKLAKEGRNICVTTSTSSGKTEIFQIAALEVLAKNPEAKILAVYPMKALNRQQVERWERTGYRVGKIDGDVEVAERADLLLNSQIVVMTPDVIHSYLLKSINDRRNGDVVCKFIMNISLVIIDELHLYKGVFGTNSAFVFRRLNNVRRLLRKDKKMSTDFAQYITASATLPNAPKHSLDVTGVGNFVEIGPEQDSSPMAEKHFFFVEGGAALAQLVKRFAELDDAKSITFVEGRQRTGELANAVGRSIEEELEDVEVYPYRAGYEKDTVDLITEKLNQGQFKGVFSTSALEIGIDIDGLNIVIIADMPHDKNSYQQRIGRVGRYGCDISFVIVVKDDTSFASRLLFEKYDYDIDKALPSYEPSLYLEDENVQNIHALCHVGDHDWCEYQHWKSSSIKNEFNHGGCFPESFVELCNNIVKEQYSRSYDSIRN